MASSTSYDSSRRWRASEPWVCSRSQGHCCRRVWTSSSSRTSSAATGEARWGIHKEVRWSGMNERSRSSQASSRTSSSGSPRWWSTVTVSVGVGSTESLIADSTVGLQHWATRSGPDCPAASTANDSPSTTFTPAVTGSTPIRAKARSRKDTAGWTSRTISPPTPQGAPEAWTRFARPRSAIRVPHRPPSPPPRVAPSSPAVTALPAAMSATMARYTSSKDSSRS